VTPFLQDMLTRARKEKPQLVSDDNN